MKKIIFMLLLLALGILPNLSFGQNSIWSHSFDFNGLGDFANSLAIDYESNILVVGKVHTSSSDRNCGLMKLNQNGDTLWTKQITESNGINGSYGIEGIDILIDRTDSNYVILGVIGQSSVSSWSTTFLMKTDTAGNVLWTINDFNFNAYSFFQDSDDNFLLSGCVIGAGGQFDYGIKKFDNTGGVIWSFSMPDTGAWNSQDYDYAFSAIEDNNGFYYVVGNENNANYPTPFQNETNSGIFKLSHDGNLIDYNVYNFSGAESFMDIELGYDGSLMCLGTTNTVGGTYVTKVDPNTLDTLAFNEPFTVSATNEEMSKGIDILRTNINSTFLVVGLGPAMTNQGQYRSMVIDNNCELVCNNYQFNSNSRSGVKSVMYGDSIVSIGRNSSYSFSDDFYITKYSYSSICGNSVGLEEVETATIRIAPNPTNGIFKLMIPTNQYHSYQILNMLGDIVMTGTLANTQEETIDLSSYPKGLYFLNVQNENSHQTTKIVLR